jgi:hypothetical protein
MTMPILTARTPQTHFFTNPQETDMLHHELNQQDGILIMEPGGALEAADFAAVTKEIDPYIKAAGHLKGVMIHAAAFPGWDSLGAFIAHLQFVRDHHQAIDKVAIVTDSEVLSIAVAPKVWTEIYRL